MSLFLACTPQTLMSLERGCLASYRRPCVLAGLSHFLGPVRDVPVGNWQPHSFFGSLMENILDTRLAHVKAPGERCSLDVKFT